MFEQPTPQRYRIEKLPAFIGGYAAIWVARTVNRTAADPAVRELLGLQEETPVPGPLPEGVPGGIYYGPDSQSQIYVRGTGGKSPLTITAHIDNSDKSRVNFSAIWNTETPAPQTRRAIRSRFDKMLANVGLRTTTHVAPQVQVRKMN